MRSFLRHLMLVLLFASPALAQTGSILGVTLAGDDDMALSAARVDRVRYLAQYAGTSANQRYYYGSRDITPDAMPFDYRFEAIGTVQRVQFTSDGLLVHGGLHYLLATTRSRFLSDHLPADVAQRDLKNNLGGVGASLEYHTRDRASRRWSAEFLADATWYDRMLGGSTTFGKLEAGGAFYARPTRRTMLGARINARSAWGDVPFFDTPYLAMRGLQPRQFANDVVVLMEVEGQRALARRWTAVAFGGVGRDAQSWGRIASIATTTAGGVGFRYLVAEEAGLRSGIDVARAPDGSMALYLQSGATWP